MKIKKSLIYISTWFLMLGASLTIGLLSFGGMLAITSSLPVVCAAFVLSVAYEGEIYLQNIRSALKKLFKSSQLERELAKKCLLDCLAKTREYDCPQFFKDYDKQLRMLHTFQHPLSLNKVSRDRKRRVEKNLGDMEKWFAVQLFSKETCSTNYQIKLRAWLDKSGKDEQSSLRDEYHVKRNSRQGIYQFLKFFCLMAGVFMGLGTSYLLVEAFAVIPWLAALSVATSTILIVPLTAIAGVAYGLLVYNAMTDMIASDIVNTWVNKLRRGFSSEATKKETGHAVVMTLVLSVMLVLTLALSICTAGTWWTIAKTTPPFFNWMKNIPSFVMQVINPLISSISTWAFNVENVNETLEMAEPYVKGMVEETYNFSFVSYAQALWNRLLSIPASVSDMVVAMQQATDNDENWGQRLNPFRMFIYLTFNPLRKLLFLGHLISIGVTADRVPGVSPKVSAMLGVMNEGVEDIHYFSFGQEASHEHKDDIESLRNERLGTKQGHDHDSDLPTKFVTFVFSPIYVLAAAWEMAFSPRTEPFTSWEAFGKAFGSALDLVTGAEEEVDVQFGGDSCCELKIEFAYCQTSSATAWPLEQAAYRIERHKEKLGHEIREDYKTTLTSLQSELYAKSNEALRVGYSEPQVDTWVTKLVRNKSSFFSDGTNESNLLKELPSRVVLAK